MARMIFPRNPKHPETGHQTFPRFPRPLIGGGQNGMGT